MKFAPTLAASAALAGLALAATPALAAVDAARAQSIANQNACMGCHAVDRKLVGPAFKDVAAKYKGTDSENGGAQAKLIKKVREGAMGNWGQIPMPANPKIAEADLKTVIDWVLAGAPAK
nr:c-type cytochrome [uncultured Ralstonia sp.]